MKKNLFLQACIINIIFSLDASAVYDSMPRPIDGANFIHGNHDSRLNRICVREVFQQLQIAVGENLVIQDADVFTTATQFTGLNIYEDFVIAKTYRYWFLGNTFKSYVGAYKIVDGQCHVSKLRLHGSSKNTILEVINDVIKGVF